MDWKDCWEFRVLHWRFTVGSLCTNWLTGRTRWSTQRLTCGGVGRQSGDEARQPVMVVHGDKAHDVVGRPADDEHDRDDEDHHGDATQGPRAHALPTAGDRRRRRTPSGTAGAAGATTRALRARRPPPPPTCRRPARLLL